jgi:hypothetical protein
MERGLAIEQGRERVRVSGSENGRIAMHLDQRARGYPLELPELVENLLRAGGRAEVRGKGGGTRVRARVHRVGGSKVKASSIRRRERHVR